MKYPRAITASQMRGINRTAVLEVIRREGPIARTVIAEKLQMSLPTVMRILDDLTLENLVRSTGVSEWSGGRRRPLIELNIHEHLTIGIDLGGTLYYGAVADLGGNILYEQTLKPGKDGEDNFSHLIYLINDLWQFAQKTKFHLRGVGIGVPGVTYHDEGIVHWAPALEWRNFPLRQRLAEHFTFPIIIENDVNLAALGELWFGEGQDCTNLVMITIGRGVGAGIIINGALYRGRHDAAGEIGYLLPGQEYLDREYPNFGALEMLISETGVTRQARDILASSRSQGSLEELTINDIIHAYRREEAWAIPLINRTIDNLAISLGAISSLYDPDLIILGGSMAQWADLVLEQVQQRIAGKVPFPPRIVVSRLGYRDSALGAVINLLHNTSEFFVVQQFS